MPRSIQHECPIAHDKGHHGVGQRPLTADADISPIAVGLLTRCGQNTEGIRLKRLPGGKNNRAYRVDGPEGARLLKWYTPIPREGRDRQAAEAAFLRFCAASGIVAVPRLLALDAEQRASLLSWVSGSPVEAKDGAYSLLGQSADFLACLFSASTGAQRSGIWNASEACLTLRAHIDCGKRRLERLEQSLSGRSDAVAAEAAAFVRGTLRPLHAEAAAELCARHAGPELDASIPASEQVFSPSDFGFHNALLERGTLCFLDFEYAGWDDIVKAIDDFICQPEYFQLQENAEGFFTALSTEAPVIDHLRQRYALTVRLHCIKWSCIILNEFTNEGFARRTFVKDACSRNMLESRQLEKCRKYLDWHMTKGVFAHGIH